MHAIISILDPEHYPRTEAVWRSLETGCGLAGIHAAPIPHFSWHIAAQYDFARLEDALREIAQTVKPFTVSTSGLGLFTRPDPVLYFPIVRTAGLSALHAAIWGRVDGLSQAPSPYYAPEAWIPHITLAYGDVNLEALRCALEKLAFQAQNWEIQIDNLAVVEQIDSLSGGLKCRLQLEGV